MLNLYDNIYLDIERTGVIVLPNIDFMHDVGSKEYSRHMRHFMLPGTLIYPDEVDLIANLTDVNTKYVVKAGMTSSNKGVRYMSADNVFDYIKHYVTYDLENNDKSILDVNLEAFGAWSWNDVKILLKEQMTSSLGDLNRLKFYAINPNYNTEIYLGNTILNSLLEKDKKVIYGFQY